MLWIPLVNQGIYQGSSFTISSSRVLGMKNVVHTGKTNIVTSEIVL